MQTALVQRTVHYSAVQQCVYTTVPGTIYSDPTAIIPLKRSRKFKCMKKNSNNCIADQRTARKSIPASTVNFQNRKSKGCYDASLLRTPLQE